jgi:methionine aminopeptidase
LWSWPWEKAKQADNEEFADVYREFVNNHKHLSHDEISQIRSAILKVTLGGNVQVGFEFFKYYSSHKIQKMDSREVEKAQKVDRLAETKPDSDTYVQPKILETNFSSNRLGPLLLHEFSHTGHSINWGGSYDFQEGHAYAIEYFYAIRSGDKERIEKILSIIRDANIVQNSQKSALKNLFQVTLATMIALFELSKTGKLAHLIP